MTHDDCLRVLEECRRRIDEIDREIVDLLNRRAAVVEIIGDAKQQARLRVYEPKREDEVYANVGLANRGPLSHEALKRVYERVIDEMRTLQRDRMAARAQTAAEPASSPPEEQSS